MNKYKDIVYLDHNATTYLAPEVIEKIKTLLEPNFANPSSLYGISLRAKEELEDARAEMKKLLGISSGQLIFTGGGSESDNLAIKGVAYANQRKGKHIITSAIEHHAVLHTCENLQKQGFEITYIPVDDQGVVKLDELKKTIRKDTVLISIMYANNETGVIQPMAEIVKIAKEQGVLVHTDAVQVIGKLPINIDELGVDLLSLSAHKFYGLKGVGALYVKKRVLLDPIINGGEQENGKRAGTENVVGILAMAEALKVSLKNAKDEGLREKKLRDKLENGLLSSIPESFINGKGADRLSNTCNIIIKYIEGESMLLHLDANNICASSGSACTSGSLDPSHVLLAMGVPHEFAHGSLRFSFGKLNTEEDVNKVLEVLPKIIKTLRAMSPLWDESKKTN
ncbi:MAG: cysteine desulfurase NifS [Candidatus Margulisbacteria bacterium GWF2_35_9]|nr:MAG: cysteine desulfurase NifS [Candidatus Margulisbacteria bacterium GWF2_35_9]